jgi:streptogramin lyase
MRISTLRSVTLLFTAATLAGCAGFSGNTAKSVSVPGTSSIKDVHGLVHGGQQPIGYATVQLYQAGATGYGAGAVGLIPSASYSPGGASGCVSSGSSPAQSCYPYPVTDANGNFDITGDYTCTKGTDLYFAATGGNPTTGVPNTASALMAGLGLCDNIGSQTYTTMNEVTTIGTVYALAAFMPVTGASISPLSIGASSTNQAGLASAFADVNTLVSTANGTAMASTASLTLPTTEINTLGDILAACINSGGNTSASCSTLFTNALNADGSTPVDVISAALNIARNPGRNVANLIADIPAIGAPFAPYLSSANDLTLAATYTGSGILSPTSAAIDAGGNVWITNSVGNSVTVVTHNLATATNYTAGIMNAPSAIAIDTTGNAWIANGGNSTLTELSSSGANVVGSPFSGGGLSTPTAIAIDGVGNIWVSNSTPIGSSYPVSEFFSTGTALSGTTGYIVSGVSAPVGIAINTK